MPSLYLKFIPLGVSLALFVLAFRVHERFWSLGFSGWKKLYLGLAAIVLGSLAGVIFEFAEPKAWQDALGWPVDWVVMAVLVSLGAALIFWSSVERLALAAREKEELNRRREGFELFDTIRDAAQGPYSFLEILNFSLKEILRSVDGDAGGIWLVHPSRGDYILACASGFTLSLQQKLEVVNVGHSGFSRLAAGGAARDLTGSDTLHQWFPELFAPDGGYNSLFGIPLAAQRGSAVRRETLGVVLICSRERTLPEPMTIRLITSAVAYLTATIAEAKAHRMVRSFRQIHEKRQSEEEDYRAWSESWMRERGAKRRLQAALAGLAERTGDFTGCAKYTPGEERWEPLAIAGAASGHLLLGSEDFRSAAAGAAASGKEITCMRPDSAAHHGTATGYRMLPVADPHSPEQHPAVLFLPITENLPAWWNRAAVVLVELVRVVLASENAGSAAGQTSTATSVEWQPDWAKLGQLVREGVRFRPERLADSLGKLLPSGWRVAVWQSVPGGRYSYHLVLAAAAEFPSVYFSHDRRPSAPRADQVELDAHLGGLVRVHYLYRNTLSTVWPDFIGGWKGERIPFALSGRGLGWTTFYYPAGQSGPDSETRSFLSCLAGMAELLLAQLFAPSADAFGPERENSRLTRSRTEEEKPPLAGGILPRQETAPRGDGGEDAQQSSRPARVPEYLPLDRAVVRWMAAQPASVRLGRMELGAAASAAAPVPAQTVDAVLDWIVGTLENGLSAEAYLTVDVRGEDRQTSVIIERSDLPAENQENNSGQAGVILPLDPAVRETFMLWQGRCRVFNSPSGPRKIILSFNPAAGPPKEEKPAPTVLIIDDQELIRDLLLGMLDVLGYRGVPASSAEEGRQQFAAHEFASVVCSLSAPDCSTIFLERLKRDRPGCRVHVVIEPGQIGDLEPVRNVIDGILSKPFRIDDLRTLLEAPATSPTH